MDSKSLESMFESFTRGCNDEISNSFVKTLFELIDKLILVFRKHDKLLRDGRNMLATAVANNKTKDVITAFMDALGPCKEKIVLRDPTVIKLLGTTPLLNGIDLAADWSLLSAKTQGVFFGYLGQLVVLGNKCVETWKIFAPLQDGSYKKRLLETTMKCEQEFSAGGGAVTSMDDIMKLAKTINAQMGAVPGTSSTASVIECKK